MFDTDIKTVIFYSNLIIIKIKGTRKLTDVLNRCVHLTAFHSKKNSLYRKEPSNNASHFVIMIKREPYKSLMTIHEIE